LTPRGVAAFARASLGRLFLVQSLVAALFAGILVWFLAEGWFPIVRAAIHEMPPEGEIRGGELSWPGDSPLKLAGNHLLAFGVDLTHSGRLERAGQIQVEFGRENLRVSCVLGYRVWPYPEDWRIAFNQKELEPRWGAWQPELLVGAVLGSLLGWLIIWSVLATLYCAPARLLMFFVNRDLSWGQSWRLAAAAQMPGTMFLTVALAGHGLGWLGLVQLGVMVALSVVMGWVYILISPGFLPRHVAATPKGNPFLQ
jgi:hypothetical protein